MPHARARAAAAAAARPGPWAWAWARRAAASGRAGEAFIFETDELIGIDWRSFW